MAPREKPGNWLTSPLYQKRDFWYNIIDSRFIWGMAIKSITYGLSSSTTTFSIFQHKDICSSNGLTLFVCASFTATSRVRDGIDSDCYSRSFNFFNIGLRSMPSKSSVLLMKQMPSSEQKTVFSMSVHSSFEVCILYLSTGDLYT